MGSGQGAMWDDYADYKSLCDYYGETPRSAILGVSMPYSIDTEHFDALKYRYGKDLIRQRERMICEECGVNLRDPPSKLCPGCQAYKEHQS